MKIKLPAVLLSGVAYFVVQGAWFTLFKRTWVAGTGWTASQAAQAEAHPAPGPYLVALLCDIIFAYVLAKLIVAARETTTMGGARVGLVAGFGIAFTALATEFVFEMKPLSFMLISAGVAVIGGVLMGAILGAWRDQSAAAAA